MVEALDMLYLDHSNLSELQIICLVFFNVMVLLSNCISSSFLCYAIWKLKLTRNISHRFILALSISDFSIGIFLQPTLIAILYVKETTVLTVFELLGQVCAFTFAHFSSVMIVIIALDRFMHMKHLIEYSNRMTKKRCISLIVGNAVANFALAFLSVFSSFYGFFTYINLTFSAVDFFLLLFILILYAKTYRSVRNRVGGFTFDKGVSTRTPRRPDLELSKGMVFVLLSILLCYLPFNVLELVIYAERFSAKLASAEDLLLTFYYWSLLLIFCSPSCNAILFIAFSRKMRRFVKSLILRNLSSEVE